MIANSKCVATIDLYKHHNFLETKSETKWLLGNIAEWFLITHYHKNRFHISRCLSKNYI